MPKMNGMELLEKIRQMPEVTAMPIIIVTARPEYREVASEMGIEFFFLKPIGPNEVLAAMEEILNS